MGEISLAGVCVVMVVLMHATVWNMQALDAGKPGLH